MSRSTLVFIVTAKMASTGKAIVPAVFTCITEAFDYFDLTRDCGAYTDLTLNTYKINPNTGTMRKMRTMSGNI